MEQSMIKKQEQRVHRGVPVLVFLLILGCGSPAKIEIDYCKATRGGPFGLEVTVEGRVQNTGGHRACAVSVEIVWKHSTSPQGKVGSDSIPVVGFQGLGPGESKDFELKKVHGDLDGSKFVCQPVWSDCR